MRKIVLAISCLLVATAAHATSFDCSRAANRVDRMVCGDAELSRLDEEMGAAYEAALKDRNHADAIRQSQKEWLKLRDGCADPKCAAPSCENQSASRVLQCVKERYVEQVSLLKLPFVSTTPAGTLIAARNRHTATLLPSGKVLIAGGWDAGEQSNSAELYDPETSRFTATGGMMVPRSGHSAILLPNGKVLIGGGVRNDSSVTRDSTENRPLHGEIYDPASGTFSEEISVIPWTTATPLANGKVLLAGVDVPTVYDPATGFMSSAGGTFTAARTDYTATLLTNGKVLIAGDVECASYSSPCPASAELLDPEARAFTAVGDLLFEHKGHTATLLKNGKVLIASGTMEGTTAELYDPATGRFVATGNLSPRVGGTAFLLPNGQVLIVAGLESYAGRIDLYDPATGTFSAIGRIAGSGQMTATLLRNGKVLFVGGTTAELYDPSVSKRRH